MDRVLLDMKSRCERILFLYIIIINVCMSTVIHPIIMLDIIYKKICSFLVYHKIAIILVRYIIYAQWFQNFTWVCGCYGIQIFLHSIRVYNINIASPDKHPREIYFLLSFELKDYGWCANLFFDETSDKLETILI